MKKIFLLLFLFFCTLEIQAQYIDRGDFNAEHIYKGFTTNGIIDRNLSNGCIDSMQFDFITPTLHQSEVGIWRIAYSYKIMIFGLEKYSDDGYLRYKVFERKVSPKQYSSINENGEYVYSINWGDSLSENHVLKKYEKYYAALEVRKIWTNNDPGLTLFYSQIGYNGLKSRPWKSASFVINCLSEDELNRPDLKIKSITVNSKYRENGVIAIYSGTDAVKIENFKIQNVGRVSSQSTKLSYYVTLIKQIDGSARKWKDFTIPSLAPGEIYEVPDYEFGGSQIGRLPNTQINRWNMLLKVDSSNRVFETDETNNTSFLFTFKNLNYKKLPIPDTDFDPDNPCRAEPCELGFKSVSKPYDLHVYNMYGQQIKKVTVKNKSEETYIIKGLSNGLYILKTENGSRKIYVDN